MFGIRVEAEGAPAIVYSVATGAALVGVVGITGYAICKVFAGRGISGILLRAAIAQSVRIDMAAVDKKSGDAVLSLLRSGSLLELMNEEVQNILDIQEHRNSRFLSIEIRCIQRKKVADEEFRLIEKDDAAFRTTYKEIQLSQQVPGLEKSPSHNQTKDQGLHRLHPECSVIQQRDVVHIPPPRKPAQCISFQLPSLHSWCLVEGSCPQLHHPASHRLM